MSFKERLLLWWGSLHIGEVIRRRAVRRELRKLLRHRLHASLSPTSPSGLRGTGRSPSSVEGEKMLTVLDAGCGRGDLAIGIARRYPNVRVNAMDIDPKLVELVRRRGAGAGLRNVSVQRGDIEWLTPTPSPDARAGTGRSPSQREGEKRIYGTIYSVDVFEHLKDPARALANLAGMLAPGGALLIHVPRATQRRFFRRFEHYEQRDHERDGFEPDELTKLVQGVRTPEVEEEPGDGKTSGVRLEVVEVRHTFGPPGALAWEVFHLASRVGKWLTLLTYPVPWILAWLDSLLQWKRGNGVLIVARKP